MIGAGTSKAAERYKTGRKTTDFILEILNLNKKEVIMIDTVSNQDFTEVIFFTAVQQSSLLIFFLFSSMTKEIFIRQG